MPIPSSMADLSTTAASNSPAGTDSPTSGDDYLRSIQAIIRSTNAKGADIASASTTDIGAATGEFVDITGTATITALGTVAAGIVRTVRFTGALTLTHNATSLILPGSANITTANGDVAQFRSLGSGNWKCTNYIPQAGYPLKTGFTVTGAINEAQGADISSAATVNLTTATGNYVHITGTTTITAITLAQGAERTVVFDGALTLTNGASLLLPGSASITTAAGDTAVFRGEAAGVVRCIAYVKKDGSSIVGSATDKIQPITASVAANALTITLNPTTLDFRSSTLGSGTVNTRTVSSAISVVVSSGSTLGTTNATLSRLAVLAIDNAGAVELAVVNAAGGVNLDETGLISTTAEGGAGASDSASAIYSTTARTNVSYRVVGFIESTQATAGTWATAPSKIQGSGGLAFQHINQILNGVTVTASGTSVDFTGIPSWAKRITLIFDVLSTNGTSPIIVQIGDSGGIENTSYVANASGLSTLVGTTNYTTGFGVADDMAAARTISGIAFIANLSGVTWDFASNISFGGATKTAVGGGSKALSAILDRVRITTVNGTDTFDAGSINILYE